MKKNCTKCGEVLPLGRFSRSKRMPDGRASWCKTCHSAYEKEYRARKKAEAPLTGAERELLRQEEVAKAAARKGRKRQYKKEWADRNSDRVKALQKAAYLRSQEVRRAKARARYQEKKGEILSKGRVYAGRNRGRINARHLRRYHNDPKYKAAYAMRGMLRRVLDAAKSGKSSGTVELLGYEPEKLLQRMEVQFAEGMSWENHGEWHIDHKLPVSYLVAKGETRPHLVNALSNLQPLWAGDNHRKHNRHPRDFKL